MAGMTFAQKALAAAAGRERVEVGEILFVEPDVCLSHDNSAAIIKTFGSMGAERVRYPERTAIFLDHCVPAADERYAANHKRIREFVAEQGIVHFHDVNRGVCHQVLAEQGLARPGGIVAGSDSHTTTAGAFGAFAAGIGRTEAASIWATGRLWFRVPEALSIELAGEFPPGVGAKDLALKIIGDIGADGALYMSVEFSGPAAAGLSVSERMLLANMGAEMGAKNAYLPPDEKVERFLEGRPEPYESRPLFPDEDAEYARRLRYDLSEIEPGLACPHTVANYAPVREKAGTRIHQALIGTCTNGRIEDLRAAAEVLRGRKVARGMRLLVFPASSEVYMQALKEGLMEVFLAAGAVVMNPGCGPCLGAHEGVLAPGEVCISTANRNFKGRMGCKEAEIYLASPETVAASAVAGEIALPPAYGKEASREG
ncbi:MAG: 3-isopropylmalate dehydratase large subunit [Thermoplasmata archaeon]|nr:MAG: 3-isopropylmalate dehydratase large subunit [Thermoplasmata archaeon]